WQHTRRILKNQHRKRDHKSVFSMTPREIDLLSPAEKYDILIGEHENFTFTNEVMRMVEERHQQDLLAVWSGVCHGWSPASLVLERPENAVEVPTPSGINVRFYPQDIKALATFLWGKSF